MDKLHNYVKIDRGTTGICSICLQQKKLSWDHILPNKGIHYRKLVLHTIHQVVDGDQIIFRPRFTQDGLKLRTICGKCNSILGSKYDPALIEFINMVKHQSDIGLGVQRISSKPNSIIRSILGHLLAAKYSLDHSEFEKLARKHVFDDLNPIPETLNVFYWAYPYKNLAVIRDVIMSRKKGDFGDVAVFQIYLFYPVAFLVTELQEYEDLRSLSNYNATHPEYEALLEIDLSENKDPKWPFRTSDDFIAYGHAGQNSILGTEVP